jgi:hypothetical protein
VPDKRSHRGAHPEDATLFAPTAHTALRAAVADMSWLLSRGYADASSLKLVGDRYELTARQRIAVMRSACSDTALQRRRRTCVPLDAVRGEPLVLDGFNVLTTLEAAAGGGVLLIGRDGACRDLASMHGTYRKVAETVPAILCIARLLAEAKAGPVLWLLDRPVSNSGLLSKTILGLGDQAELDWDVQLVPDPDPVLAASDRIVASADSAVLDQCPRWVNLAREAVSRYVPQANVLDLSPEADHAGDGAS